MDEEEFEPVPPPAPPWLAPVLGLAFLLGVDWLLYPRVQVIRWGTDLVLLHHPLAEPWLLFLAFAPVATAVILGTAARVWPRLTQTDDRRTYVFLAFSEGLPALVLLAAGLASVALETWHDAWIQSRHGLNFTTNIFRWEGTAVGTVQAWLRPELLARLLDPVFIAAHTYGLLLLGVGLPLWYAWRRDEALLRAMARGAVVLIAIALPLYAVLPVDPPSAALGGLDGSEASRAVLRLAGLGTAFLTAPNNGIPVLQSAVASLALAAMLFARRGAPALVLALPAFLVAVAPLYLGEAWLLGWAAGVGAGTVGAWTMRRPVGSNEAALREA